MRIPLHYKTTIFAFILVMIVMSATIVIFGYIVVDRIQSEQKEYAEARAENLAERVADILPSREYGRIGALVEVFEQSRDRKDLKHSIRMWDIDITDFNKRIESAEDLPFTLTPDVKNALIKGQEVKIKLANEDVYRVFVPIVINGRSVGAVEFALEFETFSSLAERNWMVAAILIVSIVVLLTILINIASRVGIYRPLNRLSTAINRFKDGDQKARAVIKSRDEFGVLGTELNRMFSEIEDLTNHIENQNEILTQRVKEATSELEKRNSQLNRANAEIWKATNLLSASERLAAAGQAAAQFAHEVGTPLNLISGHVQLLHKQIDENESAKKRLDVIGSQIERIEGIVHKMLDKTRFGEVDYEQIDINQELNHVFEIIEPKLVSENIEIKLDLAKDLPGIRSNPKRLQQIFFNLINNSADAMPAGGKLEIATKLDGTYVVVRISDDGTGMNEETQKHIFEPLFTTKERGQGTGLGLVVVKQILSEQNATIAVESGVNEGTTFMIRFPALMK
ncbi:MAG: HAMP domain-containing protein [Acidobacteria bacterium]|nr:HAMP domain-containing protein [Acidobacteriota bacterium]